MVNTVKSGNARESSAGDGINSPARAAARGRFHDWTAWVPCFGGHQQDGEGTVFNLQAG